MMTAQPAPVSEPVALLARQPIIDRSGRLVAYELLYRGMTAGDIDERTGAGATATVILNTLGEFGAAYTLGEARGFVNLGRASIDAGIADILPNDRFTLEILETVQIDDEVMRACHELKSRGFQIALDDVTSMDQLGSDVLDLADVVKVDYPSVDAHTLSLMVERIHVHGAQALAEKVESAVEYQRLASLGFDLFQGYFFAHPEVMQQKGTAPSRAALLRLLRSLSAEPTMDELEELVKQNPLVLTQLMKLVRSAAVTPTAGKEMTVRQAIVRIGTRQLSRWVHLLLFSNPSNLPLRSNPMVNLVATRARFMELVVRDIERGRPQLADAAFQTGLFSLMHVLTGQTPAELLNQLSLPEPIRDAILDHAGTLGKALTLAELMEAQSSHHLADTPVNVPSRSLMALYCEAAQSVAKDIND
ncbi:EAL and HDOD domain-containing protein [Dyella sp.]|uniref:EAL and HDOD domain-containing protein n=1 Tax=Dyella sp. TaxID=1869338 RepID=UPI002ED06404